MKITREMLKSIIEESLNECGMDDVQYESDWDDEPEHSDDVMDHEEEWEGTEESGPFDAPDEEHPGYMLLGNLKKLAAKAEDLAGLATPWDDAEPWIESKINSAAEHIDAIHDYIMYSVLKRDFNPAHHEQDMMRECGDPMPVDMSEPADAMVAHLEPPEGVGRNFGAGGDSQMAKGQLFNIARKAQSLHDRLTDEDTLPEWLQAKVTMAYQTISTISDYMDYKMTRYDSGEPVYEARGGLRRIVRETVRGAGRRT